MSVNLLTEQMVDVVEVAGKRVITVQVPRARRTQRPVFVGKNPLVGTYRRNYEGDYLCDEETVRRMIAEQVEETRDGRLLEGFGLDDLDQGTLKAYRNLFRSTRPGHPWLGLDDQAFLQRIGGWAHDRQTGKTGPTLAGLLMFGQLRPILDAVPYYVVDYQEQPGEGTDVRWVDRITTDGEWSGNLYDFYRRVIQRLTADLKVPFRLSGDQRIDDTPVHEALREALVNTLIHADYTGRVAVRVVKRPEEFAFRNPGTMRLPLADVLQGGRSDCRNRHLQKMFQLVGFGEQAGSGIPKIYRNWRAQHWWQPDLRERIDLEETELTLRMVSLLPEETRRELDERFGDDFRGLTEVQRLALATVAVEGGVTHARLKSMTDVHPRDLTNALSALVKGGFLRSSGATRGTVYSFPDGRDDDVESSQHLAPSSQHLAPSSQHLEELRAIAAAVSTLGRAPRSVVEQTILALCRGRFLTLQELAAVSDRSPGTLQNHYLGKMVRAGQLDLRYPGSPNHPAQAYRTREE